VPRRRGTLKFQRFENSFLSRDKQIQRLLQALRRIFSVTGGARFHRFSFSATVAG
jgi:hypothetical protein